MAPIASAAATSSARSRSRPRYASENTPRNAQHQEEARPARKSSAPMHPPHPHRHKVASPGRPAHPSPRRASANPSDVLRYLHTLKKAADRPPRSRCIKDSGERLLRALAHAVEISDPKLLAAAAELLGKLSAETESARLLANKRYLAVLEAALERDATAAVDGDAGHAYVLDAWRGAGRAIRNLAAFAEENARVVARETKLVRLVVRRCEGRDALAGSPHTAECIAALANLIRYGNHYQSYVHKHGGMRAAAKLASSNKLAGSIRFHALRALAEFSLNTKWAIGLISEHVIENALKVIAHERECEIAAEATRVIGNMAAGKAGRDAIVNAGGVEIVATRAQGMGEPVQGTLVREFKFTPKDQHLAVDLFRAMANLCVENKRAVSRLVRGPGLMALISGCDETENTSEPIDATVRSNLKKEAFRGLLIVAQAGPQFRALVLREIGTRIRHDTILGRSIEHLYDLGRRIKVEASSESKDDIPQTIAGLGSASTKYMLSSGAYDADKDDSDEPTHSAPEFKSNGQRRPRRPGQLISVQRPHPNRARTDRRRKEVGQSVPSNSNGASKTGRSASSARSPARRPTSAQNDMIPRGHRVERAPDVSNGNLITSVLDAIQNAMSTSNATTSPKKAHAPAHVQQQTARKEYPLPDTSTVDTFEEDEKEEDVFEIGPVLGRGGFATVYLARNLTNKELVAVKRFHPPVDDSPEALKKHEMAARRAIKEQRIWDGLSHKNVVSYRGCFYGENRELNLVAEYVPGWSLADHLQQMSRFPEHMVARISRQIVDGLDYLHNAGVTHRDLKPANILVHPNGMIKITDFGVSSAVDVQTMTGGGSLVGTPWYIAPEMIQGKPYGKSVDVWSLGCTVLELACGKRPYHNMKPHAAMYHMVNNRYPPIPTWFSNNLKEFLKTCWVWNPDARPEPKHLRRHPFLQNISDPILSDLKNKKRSV